MSRFMANKPKPRKLTETDIISFNISADKRIGPRSREDILAYLHQKNSWRMWRLQKDYRWVQKHMKKMGYNPEEAKDLL